MATADTPLPKVSVIIPVYRDWTALERCLAALAAQTLPAAEFEVLVVSNEPDPPSPRPYAAVRWLHEPRGHSYAARNAGLAAAHGAILAFTDADCRPAPDWLAAGCAALAHEGVDLAAGRIRVESDTKGPAVDYESAFAFRQEDNVRHGHGATANLFVHRQVFERVGPFDAALQSGGDFEFCQRAVQGGCRLVYAAAAVVGHPARDSLAALLRKNRRVAGGYRQSELERPDRSRAWRWRRLAQLAQPRPKLWWRLLRGQEKTAELPAARRAGVMAVQMLLHYHFVWSLLRAPPDKDRH